MPVQQIGVDDADGASFGKAATSKISFYGVTTIVQPSGAAQATLTAFSPMQTSPFGFSTSAQMLSTLAQITEIRNVLVNLGLMKGTS